MNHEDTTLLLSKEDRFLVMPIKSKGKGSVEQPLSQLSAYIQDQSLETQLREYRNVLKRDSLKAPSILDEHFPRVCWSAQSNSRSQLTGYIAIEIIGPDAQVNVLRQQLANRARTLVVVTNDPGTGIVWVMWTGATNATEFKQHVENHKEEVMRLAPDVKIEQPGISRFYYLVPDLLAYLNPDMMETYPIDDQPEDNKRTAEGESGQTTESGEQTQQQGNSISLTPPDNQQQNTSFTPPPLHNRPLPLESHLAQEKISSLRRKLPIDAEMNRSPEPEDLAGCTGKQSAGQWDSGTAGQTGHLPGLPDTIFDTLPGLLKRGCTTLTTATEREVFLIGALGVASGILPNVEGLYDGDMITPHLYTYTLAPYGTGKGALKYAERLGAKIHRDLRKQTKDEQEQGNQADTSEQPKNRMLYIPANNSKTGFFQLLDENGGRGILIETEGDTLGDALRQDYGNFSDGLRKGFHHERISYYRRGNGGELVEIEKPALSLILTSTFDQLCKLMPTAEDGLFSRFLYYNLEPDSSFRNVFDDRKANYGPVFDQLADQFSTIYNNLILRQTPLQVDLTDDQKVRFLHHFSGAKKMIYEDHTPALGGSVNRLGTICFRVCMVFTVLRAFERDQPSHGPLVCSEPDFKNAMGLIETLLEHALSVYWRLPKSGDRVDDGGRNDKDAEDKQKARELKKQGLSVRAIALKLWGSDSRKNTIHRWTS